MATPTRSTSERDLNQFNITLRSQPWFQQWHQQRGLSPSGNGNRHLSREEQSQLEQLMARNGMPVPNGMHIDSGGSLNQKNRLGRNVAIGAAATGLALTGFGMAGMGPLSGAFGAGAGAAGAGAGAAGASGATAAGTGAILPTLASTAYPTLAAAAPTLAGATTLAGGTALATPSLLSTLGSTGVRQGINAAGRLASGASDQRAEDRGAQAAYNVNSAYPRMLSERMRTQQLIGADLSENFHRTTDPRATKYQTDGPSGINPETLALIRSRAQAALQSGSDVPAMPQPGRADRLLNILDYAGQGMQAYDLIRGRR